MALAKHMLCSQYIRIYQQKLSRECMMKLVVQPRIPEMNNCANLQLPIVMFEKIYYFRHASSCNVDVYQFSAIIGLVDQSKPYTQIYLQILASYINLQLPIIILRKSIISNMHHLFKIIICQ